MRLREGMLVRTSYGSGPYEILSITRGCTCPEYLDTLEMEDPPPAEPHIHLVCIKPGESKRNKFYLSGYDEETLESVWTKYTTPESCIPHDRLYVVSPREIFRQRCLFEEDDE